MVQEQKTETILEALEHIDPEFKVKAGKIKLCVKDGDKEANLLIFPQQIKRLLMNDVARQLMEKRIKMFLKDNYKGQKII
jgi:hypothetical protein